MGKFVNQAFSKKILLFAYLPTLVVGIILLILDHAIAKFSLIRIIKGLVQFVSFILKLGIPAFALLILISSAHIAFKLSKKKLNYRQKIILSIIDDREIGLTQLFFAYKKMFPNISRTMTDCFKEINKLEKQNLIELGCQTGAICDVQDELFKLSIRGRKTLRKINEAIKKRADEIFEEVYKKKNGRGQIKIDANEDNLREILYILGIMANQLDKIRMKIILRNDYFSKFPNKEISDFNYIWSILEKEQFISQERGITGYGDGYEELPFYMTDKGLEFYNKKKSAIKT